MSLVTIVIRNAKAERTHAIARLLGRIGASLPAASDAAVVAAHRRIEAAAGTLLVKVFTSRH